jgi:hypothetical protein
MPIIIKGDLVTKPVEEKPTPQPLGLRWNDIVRNEQSKSEPVKLVRRQVVEKEIVETPSHYHEEVHGELHKLFNKKSDYLRDILDFESNK